MTKSFQQLVHEHSGSRHGTTAPGKSHGAKIEDEIMSELPPGYFSLGESLPAVHVAKLRMYTTDVRRFMRYIPICHEVRKFKPNSDDWRAATKDLTEAEMDGFG